MRSSTISKAHDMEQAEAWFHYIGIYPEARRMVWYWLVCAITGWDGQ